MNSSSSSFWDAFSCKVKVKTSVDILNISLYYHLIWHYCLNVNCKFSKFTFRSCDQQIKKIIELMTLIGWILPEVCDTLPAHVTKPFEMIDYFFTPRWDLKIHVLIMWPYTLKWLVEIWLLIKIWIVLPVKLQVNKHGWEQITIVGYYKCCWS